MTASDSELTISVPEAGRRFFGIGENASYRAAAEGRIPYIQVGKKKRVPVKAMQTMLDSVGPSSGALGPAKQARGAPPVPAADETRPERDVTYASGKPYYNRVESMRIKISGRLRREVDRWSHESQRDECAEIEALLWEALERRSRSHGYYFNFADPAELMDKYRRNIDFW